jgi:hypothetical protein
MKRDKGISAEQAKYIEAALSRECCKGCERGSYEEAYHKLQQSDDRMNDNLFMFEAGKRSFALSMKKELHAAAQKAVTAAVKGVFTEANENENEG